MAEYDDGKELDSRGSTEADLSFKAEYDNHQDVIDLLSKCQMSDQDNRERVREALYLRSSKPYRGSGSL
jgi:hypothetical protein